MNFGFSSTRPTLTALPSEILGQIVTHIGRAQDLCSLSLTCRRLHTFLDNDGFRIFTQTRFPDIHFPTPYTISFWRDAAHGLTTQARDWDRKALIAWRLGLDSTPSQNARMHRSRVSNIHCGQTMGFIPVIDSYEAWYGGDWSSRLETVAWGAGADLVVRATTIRNKPRRDWDVTPNRDSNKFNAHQRRYEWMNYHKPGVKEGLDDITFVKIIQQCSTNDVDRVIIGRVSGDLEYVGLSKDTSKCQIQSAFVTERRPVRSATTNCGQSLLAACLSDSIVSLYAIPSTRKRIAPITETSAIPSGQSGRTWTAQFLSNERLAVGYGPAQQTIRIFNVGQGELTSESLGLSNAKVPRHIDASTSVYAIAPTATSSSAGGAGGNTFLSGAYDGLCRLHDLRSPKYTVAFFQDIVDISPIYSLLPVGHERFVAGGGRHSIMKVFDLRMSGSKLLSSITIAQSITGRHDVGAQKDSSSHEKKRWNWNLFLPMACRRDSQSMQDSSVYALSRPSLCSPTLYAGLQSTVVQIDMVSIMDRHPDKIFKHGGIGVGSEHDTIKANWDPEGKAACLTMYEQSDRSINLLKQKPVDYYPQETIKGLDERWQRQQSSDKQHVRRRC